VTFPAGDETALVDVVAGLLDDEPRRRRLGEGARRLALERYSWDDVARRLEGIYERVAVRACAAA
jgi:glycosyltransferase involved in cell wall biosynthesis